MADAQKLDCQSEGVDCRFVVRSENETEAIELAKKYMSEVHGQEYTAEKLPSDHLKIV